MPVRKAAHHGVKSPQKNLVNVDSIMELLARGYTLQKPKVTPQTVGGIRRVSI